MNRAGDAVIGGGDATSDRVEPRAHVMSVPLRMTAMDDEKDFLCLIFEIGRTNAEVAERAPDEVDVLSEHGREIRPCGVGAYPRR